MQNNEKDSVLRLSVHCDNCGHDNEMTIAHVPDFEEIRCAQCGGDLGTVGQVRHRTPNEQPPKDVS